MRRGGKGRKRDELGKLQLSRQETYWWYSSTCVSNLIHNVLGPVVNRPMHFGGVPRVCVDDEPVYTCRGLTAVCVCRGWCSWRMKHRSTVPLSIY